MPVAPPPPKPIGIYQVCVSVGECKCTLQICQSLRKSFWDCPSPQLSGGLNVHPPTVAKWYNNHTLQHFTFEMLNVCTTTLDVHSLNCVDASTDIQQSGANRDIINMCCIYDCVYCFVFHVLVKGLGQGDPGSNSHSAMKLRGASWLMRIRNIRRDKPCQI